MAGRQSSVAVNAQKKAAEAALKFQQQQDRLLELAAEFFSIPEKNGVASLEKQIEDLEAKIEQLRVKIGEQQESSQIEQAAVVSRMKAEGIAVGEIAQRLVLSTAEARKLLKLGAAKAATKIDEASAVTEDVETSSAV
ncbi:hypothetical protein E4U03_03210 [Rothia nasimurium]|uniref:Uncharacterized protein n=1 Tax=Rothia nasimurium TaxID=85336 RepID=A0A4Y9F4V2_9MICC|nr:hypothetical protein [Rothia nasimurium]MBF0807626.1 hypothetical protein [Rothia nasimurium]TFU23362.1 hypothetical protein E4U03_03210 [Rothia nasimurium]